MANDKYAHTQNGSSGTHGIGYATDEHELSFAERVTKYHKMYGSPSSRMSVVVFHPTHEPAKRTQRIPKESTLVVTRI